MRAKRALDLFSGNGSVARVLRIHGNEVVTVDHRSYLKPEKCVELVEWDFRGDLRPGDFSVVVAHPPRQLEGGWWWWRRSWKLSSIFNQIVGG